MYWRYWKRGWWSWLMQLCLSVISMLLFVPLAMLFSEDLLLYFLSGTLLIVFALAPIAGWLFEKFAEASERIIENRPGAS